MVDNPQGVETKKEKTKKGNFIYRDTMALVDGKFVVWQTDSNQKKWLQSDFNLLYQYELSKLPFHSIFINALHSSSSFPLSLLYISA